MDFEFTLIVCLIISAVWVTIDINENKNKSWANDPLVGLSWACLVLGTLVVTIAYLLK